jgi:hypothetical protein
VWTNTPALREDRSPPKLIGRLPAAGLPARRQWPERR